MAVKKSSKLTLILSLLAMALLVMLLTSACSALFGEQPAPGPTQLKILAPLPVEGDEVKALRQTTVQIQSTHPGDVSRVELWVKGLNEETGKLIRSDVPENGIVLQEWVPQETGMHTITLKTYDSESGEVAYEQSTNIRVVDNLEISLEPDIPEIKIPNPSDRWPPTDPGPTPTPFFEIAQLDTTPEATKEVRHYPPPPPAPGVPYGPTQEQMSPFGPPVCDAAKYQGVYVAPTNQRVMINELDDVPARVVGGATVFRAWRMQNIGTCTWGTNYELAFYGGRQMGSGGVAFESFFPSEPPRKNAIVNDFQLIAPEGKPNQTSVLEVMLQAPVTPGIHQSYWRMRNPQGVYFGPIVGVTMDVVRECAHGTYGAPVINQFEIIGVGNVYRPDDPISVIAVLGEAVSLQYSVSNVTNIDIVVQDPTGNSNSISSGDANGRVSFTPSELGRYTVTLFADNGSCTVTAEVYVDVIPPSGQGFQLEVYLAENAGCVAAAGSDFQVSETVPVGSVIAKWNHFDPDVDEVTLDIATYQSQSSKDCYTIFGYDLYCTENNKWVQDEEMTLALGTNSQGAAQITNLEDFLCSRAQGTIFVAHAKKNGQPAKPYPTSNTVEGVFVPADSAVPSLPTEIEGADLQINP